MKLRNSRISIPLALSLCLVSVCHSQEVGSSSDAMRIAQRYSDQMKLGYDIENSQCAEFQQQPDSPKLWRVMGPMGAFTLGISRSNGAVVALTDVKVMDEIIDVSDFRDPYRLKTDADVWKIGDQFLAAASLSNLGFEKLGIEWVCREDIAAMYPNDKGTRVVARYGQKDQKYEGTINFATITMDAVTGKIEVASASTIWKFQPPATTATKSEAVTKLKSLFASEKNQTLYSWLGDSQVENSLKLQIMRGGNKCFSSEYGDQLNKSFTARVCWTYENESVAVALDAENLNPVFASDRSDGRKFLDELPKGSSKVEDGVYSLPDQNMAVRTKDGRWEYIDSLKPPGNVTPPVNPLAIWGISGLALVSAGVIFYQLKKRKGN